MIMTGNDHDRKCPLSFIEDQYARRSLSAFAKYIGMNASLLRQYAAGIKVPQAKSLKRIRQGIAKIKGDLDAGLLIDKPVLQYV